MYKRLKLSLWLILVLLSIYMMVPGRNSWGNPFFETLIDECMVASNNSRIRIYYGDMRAALDGPWWTATYDEKGISREMQFLSTDINPAIEGITCKVESVDIHFENDVSRKRYSENISLRKIFEQTKNIPVLSEGYGDKIVKKRFDVQIIGIVLFIMLFLRKVYSVARVKNAKNEKDI